MTLGRLFDEPQFLKEHGGPVSERHRAFFFGSLPIEETPPRVFGLVAETAGTARRVVAAV